MKHLSIKSKILIWFLFIFTLVIILNQVILWSYSASIVTSRSEQEIKEVVVDVTDYLRIEENGPFYLEDGVIEPFLYFYDDVIFAFYENGNFRYGYLPYPVLENLSIETNQLQEIEIEGRQYLIFDVFINENYIMRAVKNVSTSEAAIRELLLASLIVSPLIISISGFGGYFIMKKAFKPIQDITQTAETIKEKNDFSKRIVLPQTKDEIYDMTLMVNHMLDSIEETIQREKTFTSNVSHELRTPLAVLKAQVEYLNEKLEQTNYQKDILEIAEQIKYLEDMIKAILMLTKVNEEKPHNHEKIYIKEVLSDLIDAYKESLESRHIHVSLDIKEDDFLFGDPILISSLFSNLMSNAIKYNKEHGQIEITCQKLESKLCITFKDQGIGMSQADIQKIFNPFYRSDQVRTLDHLSLGIGMTIVKNVVIKHQGTIHVQSELGVGTEIKVKI